MVKFDQILRLTEDLVREFRAEKVILFGSYASGHPAPDSDVDLLVVMRFRGKGAWKSLEILERLQPRFAVDLLVRTPAQLRRRLEWNDFFLKEVVEKGKVLYEADRARVGQ